MNNLDDRHAISRSRFFLAKARECKASQRADFEAYFEASIIFARAAIHRTKNKYGKHPNWEAWWRGLFSYPSIVFFMDERNQILKEGPPKIGQIIALGEQPELAESLYYYEGPKVPATSTLAIHLDEVASLVEEAEVLFSS